MRSRITFVAVGLFAGLSACLLFSTEAAADTPAIPPIVNHNRTLGVFSDVTLALGASTVFLMPRVYYSDPVSTAGWKGRWHFSVLAPAMTMTAVTLLVDGPLKDAIQSPRPGCTVDQTRFAFPDSGCETFGGPSTHAFASWGSTGSGLGIFLVDTLKYSNGRFNAPAFIGYVGVPLTLSVATSIGRGLGTSTEQPFENAGQVVAGTLPGFAIGLGLGAAYAWLQRPNCGYGNSVFCW